MSPTSKQDSFSFRLSAEELFYLLNMLEFKTLPGLGRDPLGDLPLQQKEQMLIAGFNSLRAKGWVQILPDEEHPIGLDRLFISPLLVCASARKVLSITKQSSGIPAEKVLAFHSPDLIVLYRLVEIGVYEFFVTASQSELVSLFMDIIHLEPVGAKKPKKKNDFSINAQTAGQVMELQSKKDIPSIKKLLEENGVTESTVQDYLSSLQNLQHNVILNIMEFPQEAQSVEEFHGRTISVLVSRNNAWMLESSVNESLIFKMASLSDFETLFKNWLQGNGNG